MKISIAFLFVAITFVSLAQQSRQLQFREEVHDFGKVDEEKGPVTHEFVFTNTSNRPVKILTVQASCGCTTPGWSKEAVAPGKTGFIQASYNPQGRPGFFNKSLTVTTDLDGNPVILQIKGQVFNDSELKADDFTVSNGSLRLKTASFNLGKVFLKDEFAVKEFELFNAGQKPLTLTGGIVTPKHIKAELHPAVLAPNSKGTLKISYNGKTKGEYGFQSDNIEFHTDDEQNPVKAFSVYATIEDYFPQLSADELNSAPQLKLSLSSMDFGTVRPGVENRRQVQFYNAGKKPLDIRAVQGNCACVKASASKSVLKPGESANIEVVYDPQDRKGTQQKAVTIYSNDPRKPVQRFTFTAYVN